MPEWNGPERRQQPHDYAAMRQMIREELKDDRRDLMEMKQKMAQWETGAWVFRWFVIVTAGVITAAAGVLDWMKEHLK